MRISVYQKNKPLINSVFAGLFYFMFCWSLDISDVTQGLFMGLMMFLPGLTFPLTTCYFNNDNGSVGDARKTLHTIVSVGIYFCCVWIFSGEGRIKYITILAGLLGSLLFLLSAKFVLKKNFRLIQIMMISILSGLAFLPYELIGRLGILMGVAVFLWTIINGFFLNIEYRKAIYR